MREVSKQYPQPAGTRPALTERRESGSQEVRRPQSLAAVAAWAGVAVDDLKPLIEAYAAPEVSFLHYGRELMEKSVVDLTHEALIRQWDQLRHWVASEFQRGQAYRRYSQRAAEYINGGDLLKGGELACALEWWNPSAECGHPNLPPTGEGVEMPGGGLHTRGSPIGADSEKPNATW